MKMHCNYGDDSSSLTSRRGAVANYRRCMINRPAMTMTIAMPMVNPSRVDLLMGLLNRSYAFAGGEPYEIWPLALCFNE